MPGSARRKLHKTSGPEESKRFLETAREVGATDDPKAFDRAFRKIGAK